jgi:hypothetical protein
MFVAFMPLHILLCDEVLPYFILRVESHLKLKLVLNSNEFAIREKGLKIKRVSYFQNCFGPRNLNRPNPHSRGKAQQYQPACPASPTCSPCSGPRALQCVQPSWPLLSLPRPNPRRESDPIESAHHRGGSLG